MDLEYQLLRKIVLVLEEYERAKRAEAARRCRLMEKLLKSTDYQSIIKGKHE